VAASLGFIILHILHVHFMIPEFQKAAGAIYHPDMVVKLFNSFLKILIPANITVHLICYTWWHCTMNSIAELTGYKYKKFYGDWWNSPSLSDYFKLWSVPVHRWLLLHIAIDGMRLKILNKMGAISATFCFSILIHELVVYSVIKKLCPIMATMMLTCVIIILLENALKFRVSNSVIFYGSLLGVPSLYFGLVQICYYCYFY